jgi:predicted SAM-dependent methyltransferase
MIGVNARIKRFMGRRRLKGLVLEACLHNERLKIVVGAGGIFQRGWIPTDVDTLDVLEAAAWKRYFPVCSIDALLAEHVWEHLTEEQGLAAAKNCFTFLKPGAYARVAVPDGLHPSPEYVEHVRPGGIGDGAGDHKVLHTYKSLKGMFLKAGFQVDLLEYHDESQHFVCHDWNPEDGMVCRSKRYDRRNHGGQLKYTSIILDAIKPLS